MRTSQVVKQDIEVTATIKSIAQTYEEIAVMKIQKIRTDVLTTRDFLKRVNEVYFEVKRNYKSVITSLLDRSKDKNKFSFSTINKNGKKIKVLITADERLVGDITQKVFNKFFIEYINDRSDILIVGKVGKQFFDDKNIAVKYKYFDLPAHNSDLAVLKPLIDAILQYEKVDVYHGRLINLVTQIDDKTNLSGEENITIEQQVSDQKNKDTNYLFEPSIKEVMHFFEVQIFGSLFRQSVSEANLANLGSRIKAMEQATSNSEKLLTNLYLENTRVKKAIQNKKQLQRLGGINLWS